jgi:hypothetical protein
MEETWTNEGVNILFLSLLKQVLPRQINRRKTDLATALTIFLHQDRERLFLFLLQPLKNRSILLLYL